MNCNHILLDLASNGDYYELRNLLESYDKNNNIKLTRRYLDERRSLATLGFRCAMTRVGSPVGLGSKGEEDE